MPNWIPIVKPEDVQVSGNCRMETNRTNAKTKDDKTREGQIYITATQYSTYFMESEETIPPRRRTKRNMDYTEI